MFEFTCPSRYLIVLNAKEFLTTEVFERFDCPLRPLVASEWGWGAVGLPKLVTVWKLYDMIPVILKGRGVVRGFNVLIITKTN